MAYFHKNLKYHEDTTSKRAITKEDIDFLKALQKELNTQDHCGTANVRTWVIKDRDDCVTLEDNSDYIKIIDTEECCNIGIIDLYEIILGLDTETDYYTDELLFTNIQLDDNNILTFDYCGSRAVIEEDTSNPDGIIIKGIDADELFDCLEENGYALHIVPMMVRWKYCFSFLTQKAAENYLKKFGYNHSADAHTYCICTYRDPEIAKIMNILESVDWENMLKEDLRNDVEEVIDFIKENKAGEK